MTFTRYIEKSTRFVPKGPLCFPACSAERLLPASHKDGWLSLPTRPGRSGICVQRTVSVAFFFLWHQQPSNPARTSKRLLHTSLNDLCSCLLVAICAHKLLLVLRIRQSRMIQAGCKGRATGERCKEVDLYSAGQQRNEAVSKRMESPFTCSASDQ